MAVASVTYTFTPGANADGTQVNTNFANLVSFLNGSVVQTDGSVSMSGVLTLAGVDPSSANHATRKSYVDAKILSTMDTRKPLIYTANGSGGTFAGTVTQSALVTVPAQAYASYVILFATATLQFNHGDQIDMTVGIASGAAMGSVRIFISANAGLGYVIQNPLSVMSKPDALPMTTARDYVLRWQNVSGANSSTLFTDSSKHYIMALVVPQ